jgi:hypothetical protein
VEGAGHGRSILQREHHLEERRLAQVPLRLQHLHQLLKRQVLLRVRLQRLLLYPSQQLPEARVSSQVAPQHQRVHEKADQLLQLPMRPVGDRRPHGHVALPTVAAEQHLEGRQQRHEQRAPLLLAQRHELRQQVPRQHPAHYCSPEALHRWPGMVGRQVEPRQVRQAPRPVGQLPLQALTLQPAPLP